MPVGIQTGSPFSVSLMARQWKGAVVIVHIATTTILFTTLECEPQTCLVSAGIAGWLEKSAGNPGIHVYFPISHLRFWLNTQLQTQQYP